MNGFITYLYERLRKSLPGFEAQKRMMPLNSEVQSKLEEIPESSTPCSVLVLLKQSQSNIHVLLTLRSQELNNHKGQISFPGGKLEPNEPAEIGAIREASEEVGLPDNSVRIVGEMSTFYMHHTNMIISPIVAELLDDWVDFSINTAEVSDAFWVNLDELSNDESIQTELWNVREMEMRVPFWNVEKGVPLWGATAMMLSELLVLYKEFQNGNS